MPEKLFQKPVLRTDEELEKHRKVTWLELFFDLFFVVVISRLSLELATHISSRGIIEFLLLFIPVWRVWIGMTYYNERFETEGIEIRIFTFLLMIPISFLAISIKQGLTSSFTGFALSYAGARMLITFLWILGGYHNKGFRPVSNRFAVGFLISVILAILSVFVEHALRNALFGTAVLVDLVTPLATTRLQQKQPRVSSSKLPERFGLFVIIVLGETVIGAISGMSEIGFNKNMIIPGILGIFIPFALWWIYFDFIGRRPFKNDGAWRHLWSYLHLPLLMSIVATGAGILNAESNIQKNLLMEQRVLIAGGLGGSLIFIGLIEFTLKRVEGLPAFSIKSPLIKILSGFICLSLGLYDEKLSSLYLLIALTFILLFQIVYSLWLWYGVKLSPDKNSVKVIGR